MDIMCLIFAVAVYLVIFIGGFLCLFDYCDWLLRKFSVARLIWAVVKATAGVLLFPVPFVLFFCKIKWLLPWMTFFFPHLDILREDRSLYLRRFFLTPKTKWYHPRFIHYIAQSDTDRCPHDHPGNFDTTILSGGYSEKIYYPKDDRARRIFGLFQVREAAPFMTLHNPVGHTHMVYLRGPTWTYVKGWIKGRTWGFWEISPDDASKDVWTESSQYGVKGDEICSWK